MDMVSCPEANPRPPSSSPGPRCQGAPACPCRAHMAPQRPSSAVCKAKWRRAKWAPPSARAAQGGDAGGEGGRAREAKCLKASRREDCSPAWTRRAEVALGDGGSRTQVRPTGKRRQQTERGTPASRERQARAARPRPRDEDPGQRESPPNALRSPRRPRVAACEPAACACACQASDCSASKRVCIEKLLKHMRTCR